MLQLIKSMSDDHPAQPVLVVSNNPNAAGIECAANLGIATKTLDHRQFGKDRAKFETELDDILRAFRVDIICLAGFMRVLTAEFVTLWEGLMLNTHPSLLPYYKGLNTHARAIESGDANGGCSVHIVTADLDGGPILGQARVAIKADDTAETLAQRVLVQEHILYPAVLRRFALGQKDMLFLNE
jgi:phosphoribosylglycinamide formyltransferase 1